MKKKIDRIIALFVAFFMVFNSIPIPMSQVNASEVDAATETDATEVTTDGEEDDFEGITDKVYEELSTEVESSEEVEEEIDSPEEEETTEASEEVGEEILDSSIVCDGVEIRVTADKGVFPAGSTISAEKISEISGLCFMMQLPCFLSLQMIGEESEQRTFL